MMNPDGSFGRWSKDQFDKILEARQIIQDRYDEYLKIRHYDVQMRETKEEFKIIVNKH